jgi:hypothetical protein
VVNMKFWFKPNMKFWFKPNIKEKSHQISSGASRPQQVGGVPQTTPYFLEGGSGPPPT